MKKTFLHNFPYIIIYLILLAFLSNILLHYGKIQIHDEVNKYVGNKICDSFFKYITHLGDGAFSIFMILFLVYFNLKKGIYVLLSFIMAAGLTQFLKNYVYVKYWRPEFVYQYFVRRQITFVDGVEMNIGDSFPSGHATGAFVVFICLLLMSKNQIYKFIYFIIACLAAFSRIYLSQHWLIDITVGSIIGFSFALFFYIVFYSKSYSKKLNMPLLDFISNRKTTNDV